MPRISKTERFEALLFLVIGLVVTASVVLTLFGFPQGPEPRVYYLRFTETVSGLAPGAPVRYKGVKYGKVGDIRVMPRDPEVVQVKLELDPAAPIRVSTTAVIATESILGPYHIELRGSRATSPALPEESYIPASATTLAKLLATGETLGDQLVELLENLQSWTGPEHEREFWAAVGEATQALRAARQAIETLQPEAAGALAQWRALGGELTTFVQSSAPQVEGILKNLDETVYRLRAFMEEGSLQEVTQDVRQAIGRAVTELEHDGAALRAWLDANSFGPYAERAVASLERMGDRISGVASAFQAQGNELVRSRLGPTLDELKAASAALSRLLQLVQRQPRALIFGTAPEPKPLPGGRQP